MLSFPYSSNLQFFLKTKYQIQQQNTTKSRKQSKTQPPPKKKHQTITK